MAKTLQMFEESTRWSHGNYSRDVRTELARGPLGALSYPETGFVQDVANLVFEQLDLVSQMQLFLAVYPQKVRRVVLYKYIQGKRVEYGLPDGYGFGLHTRTQIVLVVLGRKIVMRGDYFQYQAESDSEQLGKLFALLKAKVGWKTLCDRCKHSKPVNAWRKILIWLL